MTASSAPRTLFASDALLPTGWARNVLLSWNSSGQLIEVLTDVDPQSGEAGEAEAAVRASGPGATAAPFGCALGVTAVMRPAPSQATSTLRAQPVGNKASAAKSWR